ncbi:condensation domain-containing protein, partial [Streptomyces sp. SID3343]|uniref:condensation domain-containing protein n=1 Tax=Streptomyces sp. SID3343 TaxID=2690260 RepID=UPI0013C25F36
STPDAALPRPPVRDAVVPVDERPAPLSTAQARLWFVHTSRPPTAEYNLQVALLLRGKPDVDALVGAVHRLVRRHEPLRTVVESRPTGPPVQRVLADGLPPVDHRPAAPGADDAKRAAATATEELAHVFDLEHEPPLRVRSAALGDDALVLVLTMHHLAFDGWSTAILLRELAEDYRSGGVPAIPAPEISYSDYAWWERRTLDRDRESLLRHWQTTLEGVEELELPADRPGHGVGGPMGTVRHELSATTVERMRAVAARAGASSFAVALAAWFAVLGRYSGQRDFVVGMPVSGRTDVALEAHIGCFVNTLCLRSALRPREPFVELVRRTHLTLADAMAHQALPFEELVRVSSPDRRSDRNPLFRAFCSGVDAPPSLDLDGLDAEFVTPDYALSRFDLNATFLLGGARPMLQLDYSKALFDDTSGADLARRLGVFLDWAVSRPDRAVRDVAWMTPGERRHVLDTLQGGGLA